MSEEGRRRRAARRVRPGDGRPLQPFRWWQLLSRSLFSLSLPGADGRRTVYTVDVRPMGDENGVVRADLYLDGRHSASSRVPAALPHPALSRPIGSASVVLLLGGLGVVVLELVDVVGRIPPVVDRFGGFAAPVQLPLWLTVTLGLGAVVASTERALRLRYHWLLDGAAS